MKHLFLASAFAVFFCLAANSQTKNINVDNLRINSVVARSTPTNPMNPLFFDYSSKVTATSSTKQRISIEEIDDVLKIVGQRKTEEFAKAHLVLTVSLGDLVIKNSTVAERKEESKNKEGKVTSVSYYYKVNVDYSFTSSYKITQGENILLKGDPYTSMSGQYYSTQEFGTYKEAADFWNNNRDVLVSGFARELSQKTANDVSNRASSMYGFPVRTGYDIIKTIDEKKHDENQAFRAASDALKEEIASMTPTTGMNVERVNGLIEYFKSIPVKYTDPKLKADVRIRYAAYYNLCKIYLYLDQPENVAQYADLILENGHDTKDCERMKKEADELMTVLGRTEIKTRHFNPDDYFKN